jgi:hypothetical protein
MAANRLFDLLPEVREFLSAGPLGGVDRWTDCRIGG